MKNEHEIIGRAVEDILNGELSDFFSRNFLAQHLLREYMRISQTDLPSEQKHCYEAAMRIVVKSVEFWN